MTKSPRKLYVVCVVADLETYHPKGVYDDPDYAISKARKAKEKYPGMDYVVLLVEGNVVDDDWVYWSTKNAS